MVITGFQQQSSVTKSHRAEGDKLICETPLLTMRFTVGMSEIRIQATTKFSPVKGKRSNKSLKNMCC